MDRASKARKLIRSSITKLCTKIENEINKGDPDIVQILAFKDDLCRLNDTVQTQDKIILDEMFEQECEDKDLEKESEEAENYQNRISLSTNRINKFAQTYDGNESSASQSNATVLSEHRGRAKTTYKLPKIEIKKFNGQILEWLSFWSQFEKIHKDEDLHNSDKFQYLSQAMEEGTRAKELVNSYPQTADNYPKIISALKERFGKDKILKQVYVRELIKMIAVNIRRNEKVSLTKLYDNLESHLRALESLKVTTEQTAEFLFPMVESSLPEEILVAWQRSVNFGKDGANEAPPKTELDFLMEFLKKEVESEQQRTFARAGFEPIYDKIEDKKEQGRNIQSRVPTAANIYVGDNSSHICIFCEKNHSSQDCRRAMDLSFKDKQDIINRKKACHKCLKVHGSSRCFSWAKCSGCAQQHYHLMCPDSARNKSASATSSALSTASNHLNVSASNSKFLKNKLVLLKTILVTIKTKHGQKRVRVLFDDGSQQSYVKTSSANEIRCEEKGKYFERNTLFGGVKTGIEERTIFKVQMESLDGKIKRNVELPDKEKITGELVKIPEGPWIDELKERGIYINDVESSGEDVDMLIGADMIALLVTDESITLNCGLRVVKTIFGWTIMGVVQANNNLVISTIMSLASDQLDELTIKNLWDLELIGIRDPVELKSQSEKDEKAQIHFNETVTRNKDGRYRVALPWVNGSQAIPNNLEIAKKRLDSTTKKLIKQNMFEIYDALFKQWQEEGITKTLKIPIEELATINGHFIPHHGVIKLESKTTPVRPVFDASCKMGRSPSLNDCLEKGPNLIELIPKTMFHFREGKIGVISDIRKAFQMIEIQESDQQFLMFLWWEDDSCTKLKIFIHQRVVFGVKSSPFILGAVLNNLLENVAVEDKQVAQKLKESLYVDNSITSVNSWEEYEEFKRDSIRILKGAQMDLRQWEHSVQNPENTSQIINECNNDEWTMVLGMKWNKKEDTLSCASLPKMPEILNKRTLLASINKVFDPLGFLSPAIIFPKTCLQSTWKIKIDWDEELPVETAILYEKWCKEINHLAKIKIPRNMFGTNYCELSSGIQLHIFNDASKLAYTTVAFVRVQTNETVSVQLIQARARIAPLNQSSITRLELMGCVLGARLGKTLMKSFRTEIQYFYWTDSTTALSWIKRNDEWGTFVGNRVREIVSISDTNNWYHVPGIFNPADLPSRGCSPSELLKSKWWEGPDWLKSPQDQWPNEHFEVNEDEVNAERKKTTKTISKNTVEIVGRPWFAKHQSYCLNLRVLAWIQRFKNNCQGGKRNDFLQSSRLTIKEIDDAEITMIKLVQQQMFPQGSEFIQGLRVATHPENKLYYVKTKITNRQDTGRFNKPLLLPHVHPVVDQIIEEEHKKHGHAGAQFTIAKLREKFWIIKTRKAVRKIIKKCVKCKRFNEAVATVPMAALPENRVKDANVFEVSGIDLAGPLILKNNSKVWVVLFTCAVYRAVHIESVESINTEEFILALSRFIYKCGRISIIYADNGTNFKKAAKLFGKLDWNKIQEKMNVHHIQWIFNPPASPWWGGFWERLVRTLKEYLRKILGQSKLNKVQLDTSLAFIESLMNERPLTYVSEDPEDLIPLTPAAFMRDIKTSEFPEMVVLEDKDFHQKYKDLLTLKEELRQRFRSEYLGQLVQRSKPVNNINFEIGDLVFVVDDKKKRLEWNLAKIIELFPGRDNETRVARIKTATGELVRSLQRLVPLEIKSSETQFYDKPKVIEKVKQQQKDKKRPEVAKFKKSVIINDEKITVTRSGRKIKTPLRFH